MTWYKVGEKPAPERQHEKRPALDRFFDKVNREAPNGCWEWTGVVSNEGYGYFYEASSKVTAHRWSYQRFVGPLEKGQVVCHRCDNRKCVHPDHLFSGTLSDNSQDMILKGRLARKGALTVAQVFQIRQLHAAGKNTKEIMEATGGNTQQVRNVILGRTWSKTQVTRKVTDAQS